MKQSSLVDNINKKIKRWKNYAEIAIENSENARRLVYDTSYALQEVGSTSAIGDNDNTAFNLTRSPVNRIKKSVRDLQPFLNLEPKDEDLNPDTRKIFEGLLNETIYKNNSIFYRCFDDILDLSFCAARWEIKYNNDNKPTVCFYHLSDVNCIFADTSVGIDRVNSEGKFMGYVEYLDVDDNKDYLKGKTRNLDDAKCAKVVEYFEKVIKKTTNMGQRYDPMSGEYITEKVRKGVVYNSKFKRKKYHMRHVRLIDDNVSVDEFLDVERFPMIIGFGSSFVINTQRSNKQLLLVPFADSALGAQKILNMAATLNFKNMKQTRGGGKFMFTEELIEGHEDAWKNRIISQADLPYNRLTDQAGNPTGEKPIPAPDITPSPVIDQALNVYPSAVRQTLGANLEPDITYNMSGEAIKQITQETYKSGGIYIEGFIAFMNEVGKSLKEIYTEYFKAPMTFNTFMDGSRRTVKVNNMVGGGLIQHDLSTLSSFDAEIRVGSNPQVNKEKTEAALQKIYTTLPPQLGQQIAQETADLYASSLDTPDSDIIKQKVNQVQQQAEQQQQMMMQQQAQAQQAQQQQQQQQVQLQQSELQAKLAEAHAKVVKAQSDIDKANKELEMAEEEMQGKLKIEALRASAEVAKTYRGDN